MRLPTVHINYRGLKAILATLALAGLAMRTALVEIGGNPELKVIITAVAVYFCVSSILEAIYRK